MRVLPAFVLAAALTALTSLAGPGPGCSRSSPAHADGPALVHPTGLVLGALSPDYRVRQTDTGFRVDPASAARQRTPWSVELRLGQAVTGRDLATRTVGDRGVVYHLTVDQVAGSGGPMHTLTASIACGSRHIVLTASQQAEPPGGPDWSAAWAILAATRCQP